MKYQYISPKINRFKKINKKTLINFIASCKLIASFTFVDSQMALDSTVSFCSNTNDLYVLPLKASELLSVGHR